MKKQFKRRDSNFTGSSGTRIENLTAARLKQQRFAEQISA
jgi:hypothetical protein